MAWTFTMVCVAWVFFRAESVGEAVSYVKRALLLQPANLHFRISSSLVLFIAALLLIESGLLRFKSKQFETVIMTSGILLVLGYLMESFSMDANTFIYFQF